MSIRRRECFISAAKRTKRVTKSQQTARGIAVTVEGGTLHQAELCLRGRVRNLIRAINIVKPPSKCIKLGYITVIGIWQGVTAKN
jgi:hypothetical protein